LSRLTGFGYKGEIFPVNPNATEIMGRKAYPGVMDIPVPVDYAIFNIKARLVPQALRECAAKGVKVAHLFTAGFAETGKHEGIALEGEVRQISQETGIRVIGPNCMGIYCPESGLTFTSAFAREKGSVSVVSQTGAGSIRLVTLANSRGVYFNKVISYGNAVDLNSSDFLDYLAEDSETEIVACYIEGVKNGPAFREKLTKCLRRKPVIILKAGLTESGAGAAASHTAALAGSRSVWQSFFQQTGALQVDTLEEMIDLIVTLLRFRYPGGRRVGIVGRGGGLGVIVSDICDREGLKVPPFSLETRARLAEVIPEAGSGVRNPVETALGMAGAADFYARGLSIVDSDPNVDFTLTHLGVDIYGGRRPELKQQLSDATDAFVEISRVLTKPVAAVFYSGTHLDTIAAVLQAQEKCTGAGLPVFPTVEGAAKAIGRFMQYHERQG